MQITGEQEISAPREQVWAALMDPDVLARCIDGIDTLEATEDGFTGVMNAKVGPVRAKFQGAVKITEAYRPSHYVLVGEGKGGVAGFAKGSADIHLTEPAPGMTLLSYTATSQVGGKLAQLGARLVEGAAKGYAERFFENFRREVEGPAEPDTPVQGDPALQDAGIETSSAVGAVDEAEPFRTQSRGAAPIIWAAVVVTVAIGIVAAQFL